ncbi:MAG: T9SS type A sorting domain-containing protein, partial [Candidatus Eisenbacteria bacterium]|nr:T9SS type A sorting domain-containing protein [Candidatus Eisenbacteria bacterium]
EFSYWGNPSDDIGQFVAQPWDWYGNIERFDATFGDGEITSHAFRWLPDRVECRSWRGGPYDESPGTMIHEWTYTGPHIPRPEIPRVHINLWRCCDDPSSDQEVVLTNFTYVPPDGTGIEDVWGDDIVGETRISLLPASPNPFNPTTTIRYALREAAETEVVVYTMAGRRVRTLVNGHVPPGEHQVTWDGTGDDGERVASGVYFYSLRAGEELETRRMVLLK